MKYSTEDIIVWAEYYKEVSSFNKVAKKFNVNVKTVNKWLKKLKVELNITFPYEEREKLKSAGLKKCNKCNLIKVLDKFETFDNNTKHRSVCEVCRAEENLQYRNSHKEESKEYQKRHRAENIDYIVIRDKARYQKNKDRWKIRQQDTYNKNHSLIMAKRAKRHAERMKNDPEYALRRTARSRINLAIKRIGGKKSQSSLEYLGCSINELKSYIEKLWKQDMTWDNYGFYGWHIDHIIPLSSFSLINEKELKRACHYTNLQPLWAHENFSKGAKISEEFDNA